MRPSGSRLGARELMNGRTGSVVAMGMDGTWQQLAFRCKHTCAAMRPPPEEEEDALALFRSEIAAVEAAHGGDAAHDDAATCPAQQPPQHAEPHARQAAPGAEVGGKRTAAEAAGEVADAEAGAAGLSELEAAVMRRARKKQKKAKEVRTRSLDLNHARLRALTRPFSCPLAATGLEGAAGAGLRRQ